MRLTLGLTLMLAACGTSTHSGGGGGGAGGGSAAGGGAGGGSATGGGVGGGAGGGGGGITSTEFPCAVATVLQGTCDSCHGATLANAAPMHMVTRADLLAASTINSQQTVGQRCVLRMQAATMPPATSGFSLIPADQVSAFNDWVVAGMPLSSCNTGAGGGAGTGGGSGTGGGGNVMTFAPDAPAVYVAKVKNVLLGLPPTDAEIATVTADPNQFAPMVDDWQHGSTTAPLYQKKMQRFFQLGFQQGQVSSTDFAFQLDNGQLSVASNPMLQNLQDSFALTMVQSSTAGTPFNQAMTTQTYQMTTALMLFYALTDAWQVDNDGKTIKDLFKTKYGVAGKKIVLDDATPAIALSDSLDSTSANFLHFTEANVATECPNSITTAGAVNTLTIPVKGNAVYQILIGGRLNDNAQTCTKSFTPKMLASDFTDWRPVTIRPPQGAEKLDWFYDVYKFRSTSDTLLLLNRPYVGYFTTPAFFANWQTNASNQMRVTINQTLIVATGTQIDGTDTTVPTHTGASYGEDTLHAADPSCDYCHKLLDPTRSIFTSSFSWNYGWPQTDQGFTAGTFSSQKGWFAYRGVQAPVSNMYDLGTVLSGAQNATMAGLVSSGWVQKLCYYVNSEACEASDPEFQTVVSSFQASFSWDQMVKALVVSPVTTHASSTVTATTDGVAIAVARRDHLCAEWNARFNLTDVCGLDVTKVSPLSATARQVVPGLPSDGYSRGATIPVLPNDPTLFYRAGTEALCAGLAALLIDNNNPPAGAKTWSSTQPATAITDFVSIVAGLSPSDSRSAALNTALTDHFNNAKLISGVTSKIALQSTFTVACMAPTATGMGL